MAINTQEDAAAAINRWIGSDLTVTTEQVGHLIWALASDFDLRAGFNRLVQEEARRIRTQMEDR